MSATVTGVCSGRNLELVHSLGAETVIDYQQQEFAQTDQRFSVFFNAVGKTSKDGWQHVLTAGGSFVSVGAGLARERQPEFIKLRRMMAAGEVRSVIDRRYPLEEEA
jgi:NADPH:quinone reductase-like Zn-dependent oxidoreductase